MQPVQTGPKLTRSADSFRRFQWGISSASDWTGTTPLYKGVERVE